MREMLGNLDSYLTTPKGQPPRNAVNAPKDATKKEKAGSNATSTLMLKLRLVGRKRRGCEWDQADNFLCRVRNGTQVLGTTESI